MSEKKSTAQGAKRPGWFSWRHETSEEHRRTREEYRAKKAERRKSARDRQAESDKLTTAQKLERARNKNPTSRETKKLEARLAKEKAND